MGISIKTGAPASYLNRGGVSRLIDSFDVYKMKDGPNGGRFALRETSRQTDSETQCVRVCVPIDGEIDAAGVIESKRRIDR